MAKAAISINGVNIINKRNGAGGIGIESGEINS